MHPRQQCEAHPTFVYSLALSSSTGLLPLYVVTPGLQRTMKCTVSTTALLGGVLGSGSQMMSHECCDAVHCRHYVGLLQWHNIMNY